MSSISALILAGISVQPPSVPDQVQPAAPLRIIERPARPDFEPGLYTGRIVALTDKTVTIRFAGCVKIIEVWPQRDGTVIHNVYVQDNAKPPREFPFSAHLLRDFWGGPPPEDMAHRVSDLRIGDLVRLECMRAQPNACYAIGIYRRPGGKVPPAARDLTFPKEHRWDVRMNAQQAAEERAVALLRQVGLRLGR
jgi:hypothetical protein